MVTPGFDRFTAKALVSGMISCGAAVVSSKDITTLVSRDAFLKLFDDNHGGASTEYDDSRWAGRGDGARGALFSLELSHGAAVVGGRGGRRRRNDAAVVGGKLARARARARRRRRRRRRAAAADRARELGPAAPPPMSAQPPTRARARARRRRRRRRRAAADARDQTS
jgi:hypothetical protein